MLVSGRVGISTNAGPIPSLPKAIWAIWDHEIEVETPSFPTKYAIPIFFFFEGEPLAEMRIHLSSRESKVPPPKLPPPGIRG